MPPFSQSRIVMAVLIASFIGGSLFVLNVRTLIQPDEGRYAETAREMLVTGDWVTTRLNGIKYFEKPPLHTWMSALSFGLFGIGEWQARLWNGLCGILSVLLVGYTGRKVFSGLVGWYASLVLASMLFWTAGSQFNSLDLAVAATMAISLCALLIAQTDGATLTQQHSWMLVCWGAMGLSVLTKGLIGIVLPGGVLVLYLLSSGDRKIWSKLFPMSGLSVFFLITLPWFVLVGLRNPEQPNFFFVHEHWDRFFLKKHHREGPWYYFLLLLLPASLPWLASLPASLWAARKNRAVQFQPCWMLMLWVVFILVFFSSSSSKLPGYMLPVFPALALLVGSYMTRASRKAAMSVTLSLVAVGLLGAGATPFIGQLTRTPVDEALFSSAQNLLALAFLSAFISGVIASWAEWLGQRSVMMVSVAIGGWALTQLTMAAHEPFGRQRSGADLALSIRSELTYDTPVYSIGTYRQSMTFYMGHTVIPVEYTGELEFGLSQEPDRAIATLEEFYKRWMLTCGSGQQQYAIVRPDLYEVLKSRSLPMTLRGSGDEMMLIASACDANLDVNHKGKS
jgi:4-amino-4-deoxy-L-arabinose transferase-like glycosyltransferase